MIFKIISEDKFEFATAKTQLHLLQEYSKEYDGFLDIEEIIEISDEEAKTIMLTNTDYDEDNDNNDNEEDNPKEFSLYDSVIDEDFCIVGSSEWI